MSLHYNAFLFLLNNTCYLVHIRYHINQLSLLMINHDDQLIIYNRIVTIIRCQNIPNKCSIIKINDIHPFTSLSRGRIENNDIRSTTDKQQLFEATNKMTPSNQHLILGVPVTTFFGLKGLIKSIDVGALPPNGVV